MKKKIISCCITLSILIGFTTRSTFSQEIADNSKEIELVEKGGAINDFEIPENEYREPAIMDNITFIPMEDGKDVIEDKDEGEILVSEIKSDSTTVQTGYIGGNNEATGIYYNLIPMGKDSILILTGGNLVKSSYQTVESGLRKNGLDPSDVGWIIIDKQVWVSDVFDSFFSNLPNLTKISGIEKIGFKTKTSATSLFWGESLLSEIIGIEIWDVTNVIDMSQMFSGTSSLKELNLNWREKTKNVQNMRLMFVSSGVKNIEGIESWNVNNVTDVFGMFAFTENLSDININWGARTSNITDTESMFYNSGIERVEGFESWDTTGIRTYKDMFLNSKVIYIGLPNMSPNANVDVGNMLNSDTLFLIQFNSVFEVSHSQAVAMNLPEGEKNSWKLITEEKYYNSSLDLLTNVNGNPGIYMRQEPVKRVDVMYLIDYGNGYEIHKEVSINSGSVLTPEIVEINEYHDPITDWYYDENLMIKHDDRNPISRNMLLFGKATYKTQAEVPRNPNDPTQVDNIGETVTTGNKGLLQIISVPSKLSFGRQKIGAGNKSFRAEQSNPNLQIVDKRRQQSGWELSVGMSDFISNSNSQSRFPGILKLSNTEVVGSVSDARKPSYINHEIKIKSGDNPQIISIANETEGLGQWIYSWNGEILNNNNTTLDINTNQVMPDNYTSTLEWTLISTP